MTEMNEDRVPMTAAKKGLLRRNAFWIAMDSVVIVLVLGMIGIGIVKRVEQRIALLEQNQTAMTVQDEMTSVRDVVLTHEKQLQALALQQSQFSRDVGELRQKLGLPEKLEQQLQAQQVALNTLKDSIEAVKKSAVTPSSEKPVLAAVPSTAVPAAPSAPPHITPKYKPKPVTSSLRNLERRGALQVPFVLTGVEQRGTSAFAAVAPKGFSDLSQVRLIGAGESVAGWILVSAGYGQATFRVNGRLQTVSAW